MRRSGARLLAAIEFAVGVVPALAFYVYHFPVGVFWVESVLEGASEGTTNLFTTSIAVIFVASGLGLVSLCLLMAKGWIGRGLPGPLLLTGLFVGLAASLGLLTISWKIGAYWIDYYILGAPLVVGVHQLCSGLRRRSSSSRVQAAAAA